MMRHLQLPSNCSFNFYAGHGTGNSFLIADITGKYVSPKKIKASLIDALHRENKDSGLILEKINAKLYKMHVIERDGSESSFCGNGARVLAHYLHLTKKIELANLQVGNKKIPFGKHKDGYFVECGEPINLSSCQIGEYTFGKFIVCGEPHLVTNDFFNLNKLKEVGTKIRESESINVSCIISNNIMTYERGVHDVTLSCGSACVAATKYSLLNYFLVNYLLELKDKILPWKCLGGTNYVDITNFSLIGESFLEEIKQKTSNIKSKP